MNNSTSRRLLTVSFATAIAAVLACTYFNTPSRAQDVAADQIVKIQRVYKVGDLDLYKITIDKTINGTQTDGKDYEIKLSILLKEKTTKAGDNGQFTAVDEFIKADGSFGGLESNLTPKMPKLTTSRDKSGELAVTAESGEEPWAKQMADLSKAIMNSEAAVIPAMPVKVGDKWSSNLPAVSPEETTITKITVTLDGVSMLDGVKALRLKTVTDTTGGLQEDTKIHGDGVVYLDAATGKTLKVTTKSDGTEKGSKVHTEMIFEKAKPEEFQPAKKDAASK